MPLPVPWARRRSWALHWPSVEFQHPGRPSPRVRGVRRIARGPLLAQIAARPRSTAFPGYRVVGRAPGCPTGGDLARRLDDHMPPLCRSAAPRSRGTGRSPLAALGWSHRAAQRYRTTYRSSLGCRCSAAVSMSSPRSAASAGGMDTGGGIRRTDLAGQQVAGLLRQQRRCRAYRLLDTTRSYAATLLAQSDERPALLRRHAMLMRDLMKATRRRNFRT